MRNNLTIRFSASVLSLTVALAPVTPAWSAPPPDSTLRIQQNRNTGSEELKSALAGTEESGTSINWKRGGFLVAMGILGVATSLLVDPLSGPAPSKKAGPDTTLKTGLPPKPEEVKKPVVEGKKPAPETKAEVPVTSPKPSTPGIAKETLNQGKGFASFRGESSLDLNLVKPPAAFSGKGELYQTGLTWFEGEVGGVPTGGYWVDNGHFGSVVDRTGRTRAVLNGQGEFLDPALSPSVKPNPAAVELMKQLLVRKGETKELAAQKGVKSAKAKLSWESGRAPSFDSWTGKSLTASELQDLLDLAAPPGVPAAQVPAPDSFEGRAKVVQVSAQAPSKELPGGSVKLVIQSPEKEPVIYRTGERWLKAPAGMQARIEMNQDSGTVMRIQIEQQNRKQGALPAVKPAAPETAGAGSPPPPVKAESDPRQWKVTDEIANAIQGKAKLNGFTITKDPSTGLILVGGNDLEGKPGRWIWFPNGSWGTLGKVLQDKRIVPAYYFNRDYQLIGTGVNFERVAPEALETAKQLAPFTEFATDWQKADSQKLNDFLEEQLPPSYNKDPQVVISLDNPEGTVSYHAIQFSSQGKVTGSAVYLFPEDSDITLMQDLKGGEKKEWRVPRWSRVTLEFPAEGTIKIDGSAIQPVLKSGIPARLPNGRLEFKDSGAAAEYIQTVLVPGRAAGGIPVVDAKGPVLLTTGIAASAGQPAIFNLTSTEGGLLLTWGNKKWTASPGVEAGVSIGGPLGVAVTGPGVKDAVYDKAQLAGIHTLTIQQGVDAPQIQKTFLHAGDSHRSLSAEQLTLQVRLLSDGIVPAAWLPAFTGFGEGRVLGFWKGEEGGRPGVRILVELPRDGSIVYNQAAQGRQLTRAMAGAVLLRVDSAIGVQVEELEGPPPAQAAKGPEEIQPLQAVDAETLMGGILDAAKQAGIDVNGRPLQVLFKFDGKASLSGTVHRDDQGKPVRLSLKVVYEEGTRADFELGSYKESVAPNTGITFDLFPDGTPARIRMLLAPERPPVPAKPALVIVPPPANPAAAAAQQREQKTLQSRIGSFLEWNSQRRRTAAEVEYERALRQLLADAGREATYFNNNYSLALQHLETVRAQELRLKKEDSDAAYDADYNRAFPPQERYIFPRFVQLKTQAEIEEFYREHGQTGVVDAYEDLSGKLVVYGEREQVNVWKGDDYAQQAQKAGLQGRWFAPLKDEVKVQVSGLRNWKVTVVAGPAEVSGQSFKATKDLADRLLALKPAQPVPVPAAPVDPEKKEEMAGPGAGGPPVAPAPWQPKEDISGGKIQGLWIIQIGTGSAARYDIFVSDEKGLKEGKVTLPADERLAGAVSMPLTTRVETVFSVTGKPVAKAEAGKTVWVAWDDKGVPSVNDNGAPFKPVVPPGGPQQLPPVIVVPANEPVSALKPPSHPHDWVHATLDNYRRLQDQREKPEDAARSADWVRRTLDWTFFPDAGIAPERRADWAKRREEISRWVERETARVRGLPADVKLEVYLRDLEELRKFASEGGAQDLPARLWEIARQAGAAQVARLKVEADAQPKGPGSRAPILLEEARLLEQVVNQQKDLDWNQAVGPLFKAHTDYWKAAGDTPLARLQLASLKLQEERNDSLRALGLLVSLPDSLAGSTGWKDPVEKLFPTALPGVAKEPSAAEVKKHLDALAELDNKLQENQKSQRRLRTDEENDQVRGEIARLGKEAQKISNNPPAPELPASRIQLALQLHELRARKAPTREINALSLEMQRDGTDARGRPRFVDQSTLEILRHVATYGADRGREKLWDYINARTGKNVYSMSMIEIYNMRLCFEGLSAMLYDRWSADKDGAERAGKKEFDDAAAADARRRAFALQKGIDRRNARESGRAAYEQALKEELQADLAEVGPYLAFLKGWESRPALGQGPAQELSLAVNEAIQFHQLLLADRSSYRDNPDLRQSAERALSRYQATAAFLANQRRERVNPKTISDLERRLQQLQLTDNFYKRLEADGLPLEHPAEFDPASLVDYLRPDAVLPGPDGYVRHFKTNELFPVLTWGGRWVWLNNPDVLATQETLVYRKHPDTGKFLPERMFEVSEKGKKDSYYITGIYPPKGAGFYYVVGMKGVDAVGGWPMVINLKAEPVDSKGRATKGMVAYPLYQIVNWERGVSGGAVQDVSREKFFQTIDDIDKLKAGPIQPVEVDGGNRRLFGTFYPLGSRLPWTVGGDEATRTLLTIEKGPSRNEPLSFPVEKTELKVEPPKGKKPQEKRESPPSPKPIVHEEEEEGVSAWPFVIAGLTAAAAGTALWWGLRRNRGGPSGPTPVPPSPTPPPTPPAPPATPTFSVVSDFATQLGKRDNNQDWVNSREVQDAAGNRLATVAVVNDGMGGMAAGDTASRVGGERILAELSDTATPNGQAFAEAVARLNETDSNADAEKTVRELALAAINAGHNEVFQLQASDPQLRGMASTTAVIILTARRAIVVTAGDTRVYLLRGGELLQLTPDDSWAFLYAQLQYLNGQQERELTPREITDLGIKAIHAPQANVIATGLGRASEGDVTQPLELQPHALVLSVQLGDRFLVATDGVTGHVPHHVMQSEMASAANPAEAVARLMELSVESRDNNTAFVAEIVAPPAAPAAPASPLPVAPEPSPVVRALGASETVSPRDSDTVAPEPAPAPEGQSFAQQLEQARQALREAIRRRDELEAGLTGNEAADDANWLAYQAADAQARQLPQRIEALEFLQLFSEQWGVPLYAEGASVPDYRVVAVTPAIAGEQRAHLIGRPLRIGGGELVFVPEDAERLAEVVSAWPHSGVSIEGYRNGADDHTMKVFWATADLAGYHQVSWKDVTDLRDRSPLRQLLANLIGEKADLILESDLLELEHYLAILA